MSSCFVDSKRKQIWWRPLALASLAAMITAGDRAGAASSRYDHSVAAVESRAPGEPIMAVVSLREQRITVYDAHGWILRAPVSSGQKGRETPAGIFSVLEKEAEHYSNLYDDAYMPHMQRITWSGIALHGGPLPGYPASHGCIRLPYDFAERLFDVTKTGMRVIVAPHEVAPVEITHPALFQAKSGADAIAAARAAEANEAAGKANQARLAALTASREAAQAAKLIRTAENLKARAEAQLAVAERAATSAGSAEAKEQAESAKAKAAAKAAELEAQLDAAKAEQQLKLDAVATAREAAVAAEAAHVTAAQAAHEAARNLEPVSVFISRKTQRLYVRQAFQPIFESPITIQDADRPIGTHVFTAMERAGGEADMQWSVVSLDGSAKEALDRITIPQDALDRIAGMASPRSSLIISDEGLSSETGKGTDFVVLMSGEPQGGIKFRRHGAETVRYERPRDRAPWRSPFGSPYFFW
jgi:L,D-transpeptidase catalytic domain